MLAVRSSSVLAACRIRPKKCYSSGSCPNLDIKMYLKYRTLALSNTWDSWKVDSSVTLSPWNVDGSRHCLFLEITIRLWHVKFNFIKPQQHVLDKLVIPRSAGCKQHLLHAAPPGVSKYLLTTEHCVTQWRVASLHFYAPWCNDKSQKLIADQQQQQHLDKMCSGQCSWVIRQAANLRSQVHSNMSTLNHRNIVEE
jgi:hypothetical protein